MLTSLDAAVASPVDVRAALERLARRLQAASENDPGNAELAAVLLEVLVALRGPDPEVF